MQGCNIVALLDLTQLQARKFTSSNNVSLPSLPALPPPIILYALPHLFALEHACACAIETLYKFARMRIRYDNAYIHTLITCSAINCSYTHT